MQTSVAERVQRHRVNLRASGLRPLQIWVPDTRRAGFAEECQRQTMIVSQSDARDIELQNMLDAALEDTEGWE